MKLSLLCLWLFVFTTVQGQMSVEADAILSEIKKELPTGWQMYFEGDKLVITNTGSLTGVLRSSYKEPEIVHANAAPPLRDTIRKSKISFFLLETENLVSEKERQRRVAHNEKIEERINELPEKYHLKRGPGKASPQSILIFPSDSIEKHFKLEVKQLAEQKLSVPYYYTSNYSYSWKDVPYLHIEYSWSPGLLAIETMKIIDLLNSKIKTYKND